MLWQTFATVAGQQQVATRGGIRVQALDYGWSDLGNVVLTPATSPFGQWTRVQFSFVAASTQSRLEVGPFTDGLYTVLMDDIIVSNSPIALAPGGAKVIAKPAVNAPQQQATFCTNLGYKAGCTITSYYTFAGQRVAMRVQSDANTTGVVTWLHGDLLGSASVATDAGGNKLAGSDTRYLPFGEARSGFAGTGLPTDRRFTGQITVAGGLIDMNARALDPLLGRFISSDTIVPNPADPQSLNRFAYTRNNPLRYTDSTGHDAEDAIAFLVGVAYGWAKANREAIPVPSSDAERQLMQNAESLAVTHPTFTEGRIAGGVIAIVQGVIEAGAGGTTAGGGVIACGTGVGCVAGAPAMAAGAAGIYHGSATALSGAGDAAQQLSLLANQNAVQGITAPTNRRGLRDAMLKKGQPPEGMNNPQAHHNLPWKFKDWFAAPGRGLNVNDSVYGRWVSGSLPGGHQKWTGEYEDAWQDFISRNPNATRQEVTNYLNELLSSGEFPSE